MISVTKLLDEFREPFVPRIAAIKKAKHILKERGEKLIAEAIDAEVVLILAEWGLKRQRGVDHDTKLKAKDLKTTPNCVLEERRSGEGDIINPKIKNNYTYLEKFCYSSKYKIIGYADKVIVERNTINIIDNKVTSKIPRTSSVRLNNGMLITGGKMEFPIEHLDDCKYNHFVLQLSLYMYLLWENNKHLKIGKLYIRHITMNDNDKVTSDQLIEVPYMKEEVVKILKYVKLNES